MTEFPDDNRLRWRSRRGMLELDAWLTAFLDIHLATLAADERLALARLLEEDDYLVYSWLTGLAPPPPDYVELVARMRQRGPLGPGANP